MEHMFRNVISVCIFEVYNRIHNAVESHLLLIIVWVGGDETIQKLPLSCHDIWLHPERYCFFQFRLKKSSNGGKQYLDYL